MVGLVGRHAEHEAVGQLLAGARAGRSAALVVRGEAGIGKTALLERVRDAAVSSGFRVEHAMGAESETQFAFSGLHQLCAPLLDRAGALPDPQRAALGVAFGLRAGTAADRFLVGLAVLNLLAEAAEEDPLLCLVDDAQWLDQASAQVLEFVARRVGAERLVLVFAVRDPDEGETLPFSGLPELRLARLGEADAEALLTATSRVPLDEVVRARIVAEARGNPLALLELPRNAQPAHLAGGFELPDGPDVPRRVEHSFQHRSGNLPAQTQLLLLVAASEPTGDAALLWRAAGQLGLHRDAAVPAEAAGLVEIGTRVRFRHPLVRSAVYQAANAPDRRRAHGALAEATDRQVDPDRRAWHRAQAVSGVDEEAAAALERSAGRAQARGGVAAAGAYLQHAAELTPEPPTRARRALEAAYAKHEAGASAVALELLSVAAAGPLDALQHARLQLLEAQVAFHLTHGSVVPGKLLDAAATLAPLDPALSRETYLHALDAATILGGPRRGLLEVAEAARGAPPPPGPPKPADLLLDGLVTAFTNGYGAGVPGLRRAVQAFRAQESTAEARAHDDSHRWLWLASRTAAGLFDDEMALLLARRNVAHAREAGALAALPGALVFLAASLVLTGETSQAVELTAEGEELTRATGAVPLRYAQLVLLAWRGDRARTEELCAASIEEAAGREHGTEVALAHYAMSVLSNGLGDHPVALDAAARACEAHELTHSNLALPELVEAAARSGRPDRAAPALEQLSARARASGTPWAVGMAARSRALTSTGAAAEQDYREAIESLRNCQMATHLARTHLVYGEWLRRGGRRQDARDQLRTAHEMLTGMGAEAFAARAARELRATGEHPRSRTEQSTDALTAQELHIARLVATGATSREVGEQLFLSPRTIEAHLRNIFRKLGITSRRQLRDLRLP
nr:LuxR family transcriptional regulator [Modestobacter marinus]